MSTTASSILLIDPVTANATSSAFHFHSGMLAIYMYELARSIISIGSNTAIQTTVRPRFITKPEVASFGSLKKIILKSWCRIFRGSHLIGGTCRSTESTCLDFRPLKNTNFPVG